jgi:hypothetical protein
MAHKHFWVKLVYSLAVVSLHKGFIAVNKTDFLFFLALRFFYRLDYTVLYNNILVVKHARDLLAFFLLRL